MDFYIFTLEFWQNILVGMLAGASVYVGISVIHWIRKTYGESVEDSSYLIIIIYVCILIFVGYISLLKFPLNLIDRLQFAKIYEWQYGVVSNLQQDEPLLYSNFVELNRLRDKERSIIRDLEDERSKATYGSAQELYDKQIEEANKRLNSLQSMRSRINELAARMYFVSYIEKLEKQTNSKEFQEELQQTKADCEALMKLHTEAHE